MRGTAQAGREGGELESKDEQRKTTTGQHHHLPRSPGTHKQGPNLGRSKAMLLGIRQDRTGSPRLETPTVLSDRNILLEEPVGLCSASVYATATSYSCDNCHDASPY